LEFDATSCGHPISTIAAHVMIHFDDQSKVWRKEWHDTLDGVHYDSAEPAGDSDTYESTRVRKID
jgi:hypothetical protein